MGETALVSRQVRDAIALVKQLDRQGDEPDLVAWCWFDADQEWRLVLAGAHLDAVLEHPMEVRAKVAQALRQIGVRSVSISDVKVITVQSPLARAIRQLVRTPPRKFTHERCTSTMTSNLFIEDALVLRSVDRDPLPTSELHPQ